MNEQATIHIVDDDDSARESLQYLLESVGLTVQPYESAKDMLATLDVDSHGCIILDVRMPEMGGLALQEKLSEMGAQHPIIFVTGHGDVPTCSKAFKGGAVEFLEKPVNDQLLLDIVNRTLNEDHYRRTTQPSNSAINILKERLTPRECEVMELIVKGKSLKQIAADCEIGFATAAKHRARVLEKLNLANDVELVKLYLSTTH